MRGDVYSFFPIVVDHSGPHYTSPFEWVEVNPENRAGVGLRGSVGVLLRSITVSLTAEYDNWASRAVASLYQDDMGLIRRFGSEEADFSTRVFRVGLSVGLRLGDDGTISDHATRPWAAGPKPPAVSRSPSALSPADLTRPPANATIEP